MWFITFSTKHPICKKLLCFNRSLIQVKTKALEVYFVKVFDFFTVQIRILASKLMRYDDAFY